jgi:hypothetical protein
MGFRSGFAGGSIIVSKQWIYEADERIVNCDGKMAG